MATVQGISEQQQGSNWVIPTAIGGAVGAGAGYFLSPFAKYSSLDELVKDSQDVFEGEKAVKEPTEDAAQKAFTDIKKAITDQKATLDKVDGLFKNDNTPARTAEMLKDNLGLKFTDGATKENVKVAKEVANIAENTEMTLDKVPETLKKLAHTGDGEATAEEVANLLSDYGAKTTDNNGTKVFSFKLEKAALDKAQKRSSETNVKIAEFLNKEGKVTADELKGMVKKDFADDVKEAFEKNKKIFGKNKWLGAVVGVAGGLLVGWLASKFFGSKEAA